MGTQDLQETEGAAATVSAWAQCLWRLPHLWVGAGGTEALAKVGC